MYALSQGARLEVVQFLVNKGADVKATTKFGKTTLMSMDASAENLDLAKFLISKGADPKAKTKDGHTAVWYSKCNYEIFKFWKSQGLNLSESDKNGRTTIDQCLPLYYPQGLKGLKYLIGQGVPLPQNWKAYSAYTDDIEKTIGRKK